MPDEAPPPTVGCAAGCGSNWLASDIEKSGWDYLSISGRWRCQTCYSELVAAREIIGVEGSYAPDPLPPTSRGALRKETASTIMAPARIG
jgi:hypothetical protein